MPTLLQTIDRDAREKLPLPKDRDAKLDLTPYRKFIKQQRHRLQIHHRAGGGGRPICRAYSRVIDKVLQNLWQRARNSLSSQAQKEFPPLALVALGGYGRGELNPHSDLDVMLLHAGQVASSLKPLPHLSKVIDFILMPLYDLGFKVGHSVRTIADCVEMANQDMQTKTSLIEARHIIGDLKLFHRFEKVVRAKCVDGYADDYILERLKDQNSRRSRFGDSPTMQEPNVKNGCGGLRDFQNLVWMAFFKHGTRSLKEIQQKEFIAPGEAKLLEKAYDFLLRTRNELHFQVKRPVDALTKALQPAVAHKLGFTNRSQRLRLESFMKEYYLHSRNIYLITRTVEDRLALLPKAPSIPLIGNLIRRTKALSGSRNASRAPQVDGFKFIDNTIHPVSPRVFQEQPRRLMRLFLHAQQRGLRLHPDTAQLVRQNLRLVNRNFLKDEGVRETFLQILDHRGAVAPVLRTMHEVDFLGKYIPEFGKLTCLVQHEFYHRYTADEHTLQCLQKLDEIWEAKEPPLSRYTTIFHELDHPYILYLAMLLHDAGKAEDTGDHSETGTELAARVARRLELSGKATRSLQCLIRHHLTMASVSQRRDLEDEEVVRDFSKAIGSEANLHMLTLHTLADSLATSEKLWNGFKNTLLWELHHKARQDLQGGTVFIEAQAKQKEALKKAVRRKLPRSVHDDEITAHFDFLPDRYFRVHHLDEITADVNVLHRFFSQQMSDDPASALSPMIAWTNDKDRGFTRVKICSWDRAGLFSTISGAFGACGIHILNAQVFTRKDNILMDKFDVVDGATGGLVSKGSREAFELLLSQALTQGDVNFAEHLEKLSDPGKSRQPGLEEALPVRIHFDNRASADRTVIEVETNDRLGLLYVVSDKLTQLGLNISLAKILTENGAAIDSFYVHEKEGGKVEDSDRIRGIQDQLRAAIKESKLTD